MYIDCGALEGKKVIIHGTSIYNGVMIYRLQQRQIQIDRVMDSRIPKWGKVAYGHTILKPDEVLRPFDDDLRILVAGYYASGMIAQLQGYGYRLGKHILLLLDGQRACQDYHYLDRSMYEPLDGEEDRASMLRSLETLNDVCTEHNIRYSLAAGTLLGAVRHKGFIPWDDDADVHILFKDLIRLTEVMKEREDYSVLSCVNKAIGFYETIGFFSDNSVLCDYMYFPKYTGGFPVDIFYLIGVPEDEAERAEHMRRIKMLESESICSYNNPERRDALREEMITELLRYDFDECRYYVCPYTALYMEDPWETAIFDHFETVPFEHLQLKIAAGYDTILKKTYGDYMTPPENPPYNKHGHKAYRLNP